MLVGHVRRHLCLIWLDRLRCFDSPTSGCRASQIRVHQGRTLGHAAIDISARIGGLPDCCLLRFYRFVNRNADDFGRQPALGGHTIPDDAGPFPTLFLYIGIAIIAGSLPLLIIGNKAEQGNATDVALLDIGQLGGRCGGQCQGKYQHDAMISSAGLNRKQQDAIAIETTRRQSGPVQHINAFLTRFPLWMALLAGGISALGFAPWSLWPLTLGCFALLMHLVSVARDKRRAFLTGWLFGVGQFSIGNQWIAVAFTFQAAMPVWLGYGAVVALSLYLAVYPAFAALGGWWMGRKAGGNSVLPFILAFAGCWIVTEWLRSWVFTGFAWNPLSAVFAGIAWPAETIGTYGVSGMIAVVTGGLILLCAGRWKPASAILIPSILVGIIGALDTIVIYRPIAGPDANYITVVQPDIPQSEKYDPNLDATNFTKLARFSHRLPGQAPRLLLWPEVAIPDYLEDGYPFRFYQFQPGESAQGARARLMTLLAPGDVIATGVDRLVIRDGQLVAARNSVTAMDAGGRLLGHYDKAHLVPYGEYLPMPWLLKTLGLARLVPGDIDFWPGPGPQTMTVNVAGRPVKIGLQICYEVIFSGQVVDRGDRPDFIFNPSNDSWFGTIGPPQFLAQARLRAIEEGLPVVRATPTGISAVIDSHGRIFKQIPMGKAGRIDTYLPKARQPTLFARYGNILPLAFAALLMALAFYPLARRRGSR